MSHLASNKKTPEQLSAQTVNVAYLKDDLGRVQVVVPSNNLLDINHISRALSRQLEVLPAAEVIKLKASGKIPEFPALAKTKMTLLVDTQLLDYDQVYMQTEQELEAIPMDKFLSLVSRSQVGYYSSKLLPIDFNDEQDLDTVNNAIDRFTQLRIKQRLSETIDLPPLPEIANRIIELRTNPNSSPADLAKAVELDPSLAAQVLNWSRSPFYGVQGEINTIEEAVVRVLGFDLVLNLALGLALGRTLSVPKDGPHGYTPYWQQSIISAALCHELIKAMPAKHRPDIGLAYLCGLLQSFGFLILAHVFPPQFSLINRHIEANPQLNRMNVEQNLLGLTREQIAALLLQQWRMPEALLVAVRQQNNPLYEGEHANYAKLLYVVSRSLRQQGFGDGPDEPIKEYILDDLGLRAKEVVEITQSVLERSDSFSSLVTAMNR